MTIAHAHDYQKLIQFRRKFWLQSVVRTPLSLVELQQLNQSIERHRKNIRKIFAIMAKKTTPKTEKFTWKGYVNVNLSSQDATNAKAYISDTQHVWASFNDMLVEGYNVKIYFDDKQDSYKAVATCYSPDDDNYGYALSAYADDYYTAIAVLLYKHNIVTSGVWSDYSSSTSNPFG